MAEFHKNKINEINNGFPNNISIEDDIKKLYFRDYYIKDFKYISPDMINLSENKIINTDIEKTVVNSKTTSNSLIENWLKEVTKGLRHFFYQGSLHGVKYIFEPTFNMKEKITWIVIMLISIIICVVITIQLFSKWTSTPFVNIIDSMPTPIWAVPFPTVVLCPHLHVKSSFANVSELNGLEEFFASLVCPRLSRKKKFLDKTLDEIQMNMFQRFIINGSPKCSEIVKACNWPTVHDTNWELENCCDLFQPIFTNYGLCYAFNSLPLNGMSNSTISWQKSFNERALPAPLQWGLDSGYPKVFPPDLKMPPFRIMTSGETNGLGVELFLNKSEHQIACEGNSLGFTVLINSPSDHVYTSTVLRVPMDRMTTIEVTPLTYKTDLSLRETLSPYKRQCYFQSEKSLQYYEFYTDSNCKHDLLVREAQRMCDCVLYNWPSMLQKGKCILERICSTKGDFDCISGVRAKVEETLINAYYAESEDENGISQEGSKSCHPSCNDVIYSSQVFYSDLIKDLTGSSTELTELRPGEVTQINVHFYDDMFLGQHRHAQYDDLYFVGAIGGLLSLCLGFSMISVAEFVYFVLLKPAYIIFRNV